MKKYLFCVLILLTVLAGCSPKGNNINDIEEQEIIIMNGNALELGGTLTLPVTGAEPVPIVIFVHGSGPNDRDETIGVQKPFKDIAKGLAEKGIAAVRYDKVTYTHQSTLTDYDLTVYDETINDVFSIIDYVNDLGDIDDSKIFIVGHSMGGYLIPRIDEADTDNKIAGYISLAGNVRRMEDILLEQIDYIFSIDNVTDEQTKTEYKNYYNDGVNTIKALTDADRGSTTAILGAYPTYWIDLASYDPETMVKSIKEPMLFIQGGHDYQVMEVDFNMWKEALKGNSNAEFKLFPELTHSFVKTENMSTPDDYSKYLSVDEEVVSEIANFIKK